MANEKKEKGIAVLVEIRRSTKRSPHDTITIRGLNELVSGNISDSQYITYMTSKYEERRAKWARRKFTFRSGIAIA